MVRFALWFHFVSVVVIVPELLFDCLPLNQYVRVFTLLAIWIYLANLVSRYMGNLKNNETADIFWDENTMVDESDEHWFEHLMKYVFIGIVASFLTLFSTITTCFSIVGLFPPTERKELIGLMVFPALFYPLTLFVWFKDMVNRGVSELLYVIWFILTGIIWLTILMIGVLSLD